VSCSSTPRKWHWHTGEFVVLPFVSVFDLRDGKIARWWDYWDLGTLMNAAPQWLGGAHHAGLPVTSRVTVTPWRCR